MDGSGVTCPNCDEEMIDWVCPNCGYDESHDRK